MIEFFRGKVTARDWAAVGGIVGLTVLLGVAFFFLIYSQLLKELDNVIAEDKEVMAHLEHARATQRDIDALRAKAAKMHELVAQFEERLPEKREIPTLFEPVEGFEAELGVTVGISPLPKVEDMRKETIPYTVVARGNFHQIVSFINRIERFERYLKVSDLVIGEESESVSEATFTLSTYRFIQPSESAAS